MFTLGIFTTHIPYIALVVFYAFFWVFGVNKASSGEIQMGENRISIEIPTLETINEIVQHDSYNAQNHFDQFFLPPDYNTSFSALQKLRYKVLHLEKQRQNHTYAVLFSRPPPFLS